MDDVTREEVDVTIVLGIAIALMLVGAVMLVAGQGASGLWIAVITVGIAVVAFNLSRRNSVRS